MFSPTRAVTDRLLKYAQSLRFPRLLAVTLILFAIDFFVPDVIPFADEVLLGLIAALLATLRKSRRDPAAAPPLDSEASAQPGAALKGLISAHDR